MENNCRANFEKLKEELVDDLIKCSAESEEVWEILSEEQTKCMEITAKQVFVSDKFSHFHEIWLSLDSSEEIEQFHRLTELDEEVAVLNSSLSAFELKVQKTTNALKEWNERFSAGVIEMDLIRNTIMTSSNYQDLCSLQFPDFQRLKLKSPSYQDPKDLDEEWTTLNIDGRITVCLVEIQNIVYSQL